MTIPSPCHLQYRTIGKEGFAEIVVSRSRFIAYLRPARTREEAELFFKEIRRRHRDARHNVPCFVVGEDMREQWSSEDGEPQGTAGAPMLQLLVSEGVTNAAAVVTRYFGGVKLGTGGLVRAYTVALKAALADAGVVEMTRGVALRYRMAYPAFEKMKAAAAKRVWTVMDADYGDVVTFTLSGPEEDEAEMRLTASAAAGADAQPVDTRATVLQC
ncbi:MAG: IMPACT family protein [Clostridiales Family XIII bacterium]|nr:IMPACT family protein [Clostridiales Family XIII bacterium]